MFFEKFLTLRRNLWLSRHPTSKRWWNMTVESGLYHNMADRNPAALFLLIAAPEPPTFLVLDDEFLTSSNRQFSGIVSSVSGSCLTACIHLDDIFGHPAAFFSLIGTPNPNPCSIVLPGAV